MGLFKTIIWEASRVTFTNGSSVNGIALGTIAEVTVVSEYETVVDDSFIDEKAKCINYILVTLKIEKAHTDLSEC